MGSDPEPLVTLDVDGNSTRAAVALASAISSELAKEQLPRGVTTQLVGNHEPVYEQRGGLNYELGSGAGYLLLSVVVHFGANAGSDAYQAVKRAVLRYREKDPTTPIYGPDGRPIYEWLADQEERGR